MNCLSEWVELPHVNHSFNEGSYNARMFVCSNAQCIMQVYHPGPFLPGLTRPPKSFYFFFELDPPGTFPPLRLYFRGSIGQLARGKQSNRDGIDYLSGSSEPGCECLCRPPRIRFRLCQLALPCRYRISRVGRFVLGSRNHFHRQDGFGYKESDDFGVVPDHSVGVFIWVVRFRIVTPGVVSKMLAGISRHSKLGGHTCHRETPLRSN